MSEVRAGAVAYLDRFRDAGCPPGGAAIAFAGLALAAVACLPAPGNGGPMTQDTARSTTTAPTDTTSLPWTTPTSATIDILSEPGPTCDDPARRDEQPFVVTELAGGPLPPDLELDGSGVAIGDFDRDGDLDVMVLGHDQERYVEQRDGVFVALEEGYKDPAIGLSLGLGAAVADFDGDGDLDIFVSRYGAPNVLLQNDGEGYFSDIAAAAGVQGAPTHHSASASWTDWDNDGDLDLYVAGHGELPLQDADREYLYLNDGDGTFTDASDLVPQEIHDGYTFVPLFVDLDQDGWRDLYVAQDFGNQWIRCLLAWNRQGSFVLDDDAVGLDRPIQGMGIGVGDVNEDGAWDLFVTAWGNVDLMLSSPAGLWIDYSDALGVRPAVRDGQEVGWGTELADMDNDTRLDAVAMFGELAGSPSAPDEPNALWRQDPIGGTFSDEAPAWGFDDRGANRGLGVADLDGDGWLDVVAPDLAGPTKIHRAHCGAASWLEVALEQPGTLNPDAVGATVEATIGDRTLRRPVLAGGTGFGTGLPPVVHFGLGDAEIVDNLVVRWPDGATSELGPVETRAKVTVVRR